MFFCGAIFISFLWDVLASENRKNHSGTCSEAARWVCELIGILSSWGYWISNTDPKKLYKNTQDKLSTSWPPATLILPPYGTCWQLLSF